MLDGWQRNKSAAQYHFGDRDGLIRAILAIGMGPINKRRFHMLLEYDRSERRPDLRQLVKCLILPLAIETLSDPSSYYARFLAQNHADPLLSGAAARTLHADTWRMWIDHTLACLDGIPEAVRQVRLVRAANVALFAVGDWEAVGETLDSVQPWVSDFADSCVGLLTPPTSAETLALIRGLGRSQRASGDDIGTPERTRGQRVQR